MTAVRRPLFKNPATQNRIGSGCRADIKVTGEKMDNNYSNDPGNPAGQSNGQDQGGQNYGGYPNNGQYGGQNYGGCPSNGQYGGQNYGGYPSNGQYGGQNYGGYPNNGQAGFYGLNDPYASPQYDEGNGKAIGSLVVGIINILTMCVPVLGICMGLIGLLLGIGGLKSSKKGIAMAGIIISSLTLVFAVFAFVIFILRIVKDI